MNTEHHSIRTGLYRHYKGRLYKVIDFCRHSETGEELVLYRPLHGESGLWVRPKDMFLETVVVNGEEKPRFEFLSET